MAGGGRKALAAAEGGGDTADPLTKSVIRAAFMYCAKRLAEKVRSLRSQFRKLVVADNKQLVVDAVEDEGGDAQRAGGDAAGSQQPGRWAAQAAAGEEDEIQEGERLPDTNDSAGTVIPVATEVVVPKIASAARVLPTSKCMYPAV
ncbi:hypothetical protein WJX72_007583 [[Myrmecia] bisecta]|uniref:Uncharacterized protein n=1 Tax=[Myrmecia] bisecta TaxID=41462 RepID=A0AAW1PFL3_9CHLO